MAADKGILTISKLKEQAGLNFRTVSGLWNGKSARVDFPTLDALCKALECNVGDFLEYVAEKPNKRKG